jgi:hypothetical protein
MQRAPRHWGEGLAVPPKLASAGVHGDHLNRPLTGPAGAPYSHRVISDARSRVVFDGYGEAGSQPLACPL